MVLEAKAPRAGEGVSGGGISSLLGSRLPLHTFGRPQLNIITRNEDPGIQGFVLWRGGSLWQLSVSKNMLMANQSADTGLLWTSRDEFDSETQA